MNSTSKSMPLALSVMNLTLSLETILIIMLTALAFRTSLIESLVRGCLIVLLVSPLILMAKNGFYTIFYFGIACCIGMLTFGWLHQLISYHNPTVSSIILAWIPSILWLLPINHDHMELYQIAITAIFGTSFILTPLSLLGSLLIVIINWSKGWPQGEVLPEDNHYWYPARMPR